MYQCTIWLVSLYIHVYDIGFYCTVMSSHFNISYGYVISKFTIIFYLVIIVHLHIILYNNMLTIL